MSDVVLAAVVGSLAGSLLTALVTKGLDIYQKSQEHRQALGRVYFEKKLEAAEQTVRSNTRTASAVNSVLPLLERLTANEPFEEQVFHMQFKTVLDLLTQSTNPIREGNGSALLLFFDIDEEFWGRDLGHKYHSHLTQIGALFENIQKLRQRQNSMNNAQAQDKLDAVIEAEAARLRTEVKEMRNLLDEMTELMKRLMRQTREEFRHYDLANRQKSGRHWPWRRPNRRKSIDQTA